MRAVALLPAHCDELARLEKLCFSVPWTRAMVLEELRNPAARYVGLQNAEGELAAYGGIQIAADEGYITNIATAPPHRRKGLANRILRLLLDTAERGGVVRVGLEVRESNLAAQGLYEKQGFRAEGRRKAYYTLPTEDALVMNLYFSDAPLSGGTL